jgi:hypothetical protein
MLFLLRRWSFISAMRNTLLKKPRVTQDQNTRSVKCWLRIFPTDLCGWRNFPSPLCCAPASRMAFVTMYTVVSNLFIHKVHQFKTCSSTNTWNRYVHFGSKYLLSDLCFTI